MRTTTTNARPSWLGIYPATPDIYSDTPHHRTLADEWAYARLYTSDAQRCQAYLPWLHTYNHHRGHTALGGQPPASRVPNLSGQYN